MVLWGSGKGTRHETKDSQESKQYEKYMTGGTRVAVPHKWGEGERDKEEEEEEERAALPLGITG